MNFSCVCVFSREKRRIRVQLNLLKSKNTHKSRNNCNCCVLRKEKGGNTCYRLRSAGEMGKDSEDAADDNWILV